jgi:hypothetical protein
MALGEAKVKCKGEFKQTIADTGYTIEQIREYVATHRELRRPLQHVPHAKGVIGRAATFCLHVGKLMDADPEWSNKKSDVYSQEAVTAEV